MNYPFLFCLFAAFAIVASGKRSLHLSKKELQSQTWALIASGAAGWDDYRMQADVCHAYHLFHEYFGIPDERIIVMMVDDIANNEQNPFPGKVINEVGGNDVYAGVPHDYTGGLVTPENFQKLMIGESVPGGSNKTLKSTSDDNVLIYFCDHGFPNMICFPYNPMKTPMIQDALDQMVARNMFKNLIFYLDTCYSGSIFYNMNLADNMFVLTACGVTEVTYSCKYDKDLKNYPCDLFSHAWITDMETNNKPGHTFYQQYDFIQDNIEFAHSCAYGNRDRYFNSTINSFFQLPDINGMKDSVIGFSKPDEDKGPVSQFDIPLDLARHLYEEDPTESNRKRLEKELTIKKLIDTMNTHIVQAAKPGLPAVALSSCSTCDMSCPCYQYCLKQDTPSNCQKECCSVGIYKCQNDPPSSDYSKCLDTLVDEYYHACDYKHNYLGKAGGIFMNLCKRPGVNVQAAVEEIQKQCTMYKSFLKENY